MRRRAKPLITTAATAQQSGLRSLRDGAGIVDLERHVSHLQALLSQAQIAYEVQARNLPDFGIARVSNVQVQINHTTQTLSRLSCHKR